MGVWLQYATGWSLPSCSCIKHPPAAICEQSVTTVNGRSQRAIWSTGDEDTAAFSESNLNWHSVLQTDLAFFRVSMCSSDAS